MYRQTALCKMGGGLKSCDNLDAICQINVRKGRQGALNHVLDLITVNDLMVPLGSVSLVSVQLSLVGCD